MKRLTTIATVGALALALTASAAGAQERLTVDDSVLGDGVNSAPELPWLNRWQYGMLMPQPHGGECRSTWPPRCTSRYPAGGWR